MKNTEWSDSRTQKSVKILFYLFLKKIAHLKGTIAWQFGSVIARVSTKFICPRLTRRREIWRLFRNQCRIPLSRSSHMVPGFIFIPRAIQPVEEFIRDISEVRQEPRARHTHEETCGRKCHLWPEAQQNSRLDRIYLHIHIRVRKSRNFLFELWIIRKKDSTPLTGKIDIKIVDSSRVLTLSK